MAGQPAGMCGAVVGRHQHLHALVVQRARGLPEEGVDRRVGRANQATGIDGDHAVAQVFEDQAQLLLAQRQFVPGGVQLFVAPVQFGEQALPGQFARAALADVAKNDHRADSLTVGNDRRAGKLDRKTAAVLAPEQFVGRGANLLASECGVERALGGGIGRSVGPRVVQQAMRWLVEHLGGVPAEQAFGGFVDVGDAAAGVGAVKALGH